VSILAAIVLAVVLAMPCAGQEPVRIGSKAFAESHILAELAAQLLESRGVAVERKLGLGGTLIAFEALQAGEVDLYPEYSGTVAQAILRQPGLNATQLRQALAARQLQWAVQLGFSNSYAMAMSDDKATSLSIDRVSDLAKHPQLKFAFSLEFLKREDGWPALQAHYQLPQRPRGIEHALAYRAIANGQLDVTDAYTTDGEIEGYKLRLLADDRQFFPNYSAGFLARSNLSAAVVGQLQALSNLIDEATMRGLNRQLALPGMTPPEVASQFLLEKGLIQSAAAPAPDRLNRIAGYLAVHLKLTVIALLLACLTAVPLALWVSRHPSIARGLLYVTGLIQTIPSLALLALLIPLVGLGQLPAIIALFLYSLLPIVRNTLTGIFSVDPLLKQVATGMGLTRNQQLLRIELPLAMPTLLAGIKTAAIISIGTATLAAFVGAGGLGEPIITGLTLNDHALILEGAIPAALLAVLVELLFDGLERVAVPAHLRDGVPPS
tara:strand:+ start:449087 stop:450568 length:1482 start_codon:yes stop_codon:yes gene_type:complete